MRWVVPAEPLYILTVPSAPIGTMTRLGAICPGVRFRLDAQGRSTPEGQAVTHPDEVCCVPVTFSTTAVAPEPGTPARHLHIQRPTSTHRTRSRHPVPSRASNNRDGVTPTKPSSLGSTVSEDG